MDLNYPHIPNIYTQNTNVYLKTDHVENSLCKAFFMPRKCQRGGRGDMIYKSLHGYIDGKCQMHAIFCCFHYGVEEGVIWRESAAPRPSVKWRLGEAGEKRSEIRNCQLV